MIPDLFIPNRQDTKIIVDCIKDEIKQMASMNIRFYITKISGDTLYSVLHHCCTEINKSTIPEFQNSINYKLLHKTKFKKVIWE